MSYDYASRFDLAARSYLVPWFEALKLSRGYEAVHESGDFISIDQQRVHALFGSLKDHNFESWWHAHGKAMFGDDCTRIHARYASTDSDRIKYTAIFHVPHGMSITSAQEELGVLLKRIDLLMSGKLSSSPHLWPTYKTRISITSLNTYLKVLKNIRAEGSVVKGLVSQVGQQMRLVPKSQIRFDDMAYVKKDKRKHNCQVTSSYYLKGLWLVENAAMGVFPSILKPKTVKKVKAKTAAKSRGKVRTQPLQRAA